MYSIFPLLIDARCVISSITEYTSSFRMQRWRLAMDSETKEQVLQAQQGNIRKYNTVVALPLLFSDIFILSL